MNCRRYFHLIFILLVSVFLSLPFNSRAAFEATCHHNGSTKQPGSIFPNTVGQIGGSSRALAYQGDYVYLALGMQMAILSVTNPANPQVKGSIGGMNYFQGITVSGNHAYLPASIMGVIWLI